MRESIEAPAARHVDWPERVLVGALALNILNTLYLSWRYVALHAGLSEPGTGLCSWTATVNCDAVLLTPEARAFYVPNALLGFGFSFGCLLWWLTGKYLLDAAHRYHIARTLVFWLAVSSLFTLRFWWLLLRLPALCPVCPWHHILTYVALAGAYGVWRRTPRPSEHSARRPLVILVGVCVTQFFLWLGFWLLAFRFDRLSP